MKKLSIILLFLFPVIASAQIINGKEYRFTPKSNPSYMAYPGDSSVLMVNRLTGKVHRTHVAGGAGSVTLQQALDFGSTLNKHNTITGTGFNMGLFFDTLTLNNKIRWFTNAPGGLTTTIEAVGALQDLEIKGGTGGKVRITPSTGGASPNFRFLEDPLNFLKLVFVSSGATVQGQIGIAATEYYSEVMNSAGNFSHSLYGYNRSQYIKIYPDSSRINFAGLSYVNSRLGIGVTFPSTLLHVISNTGDPYVAEFYNSNLGTAAISVGFERTTNNAGILGFDYTSAGSTNNKLHLSFVGGANLLTLRADGNIGINQSAPAYKFDVNGSTRLAGAVSYNTVAPTDANYVADSDDHFIFLPDITATRSLTLPSAASHLGRVFEIWIKNDTAENWTFSPLLYDAAGLPVSIAVNQTWYRVVSDGTNWNITN